MLRTRWAAIGAAVAVTLGGGGLGVAHAVTGSGERPIYLPINPCRLADLRPAPDQVGPRSAPLGPNEVETFDGWGAIGDCNLPSGTAGLALNVTAVNASADTWLRFWPTGETEPGTANLNPSPGQPPTPNAVNVSLNGSGEFNVRNRFGTVNVVIDVVGVYDDHHHDDRYYTEAETDTKLAAKANSADVYTKAQVYTKAEADAAHATKANAADVYTKAEADAAHATKANAADVYTKAEIEQQHLARRLFPGAFSSTGTKTGTGPYTVSKGGTGEYTITYAGLADLGLPFGPVPIVVAMPNQFCNGGTAIGSWSQISGTSGILTLMSVRIETYDSAGTATDCGGQFMLRFPEPDALTPFAVEAIGVETTCTDTPEGPVCEGT